LAKFAKNFLKGFDLTLKMGSYFEQGIEPLMGEEIHNLGREDTKKGGRWVGSKCGGIGGIVGIVS